jgi:hypothetical protein
MRKLLVGILALLFAIPSGLVFAQGKPVDFDPSAVQPITIILPKTGIEEVNSGRLMPLAFDANINYGRAFSTTGYGVIDSQDIDGYDLRWRNPRLAEVRKLKGTTTKTGVMYYNVDVDTAEQPDHYVMTLRLRDKYQYTPFDLARKLYTVTSFEPEEAISQLQRPIIHFRMEIDSQFDAESVRANFERLGEPALWNQVMADRFGAREKAEFYSIEPGINGVYVRYLLDVFPYRTGSKAVIVGQIVGAPTSDHTVDFRPILEASSKRLREIAED